MECGLAHEVERDEALNLSTNEKHELVMLVPVKKEGTLKNASLNRRNAF
jgi:hypothetical protein